MNKSLDKRYKATKIGYASLQDQLSQAGIQLSLHASEKLWAYHKLLRTANRELNLSRIHNFENIVRKHYVDSLLVFKILQNYQIDLPHELLDIGSGPGLPGIPLAIQYPHVSFCLAETRKHRCLFLESVVEKISLKNVRVFTGSISQVNCPPIGGAITRALEAMPETLQRVREGLKTDGLLIFMKGPNCDKELEEAHRNFSEYSLLLDHHYTLDNSNDKRRLVVWQKQSSSLYTPTHTSISNKKSDGL